MDSGCWETESWKVPGIWWRRAGALSFPLGLISGRGNPCSFITFFSPNEMFIVVGEGFCFVLFSLKKMAYSTPILSPTSPQAGIQTRKWGRLGRERGLDGLPWRGFWKLLGHTQSSCW